MDSGKIPWDDNARAAANNALRGSSGSMPPAFDFDYTGEANKAYGELGTYYGRILKESQGDMNKVLSRLLEDYNSGTRFRQVEDTQVAQQEKAAKQGVVNNALSRGLYQRSAFDSPAQQTEQGYGIPTQNFQTLAQTLAYQGKLRQKQREAQDISYSRQKEDIGEKQRRYEFDLEQQRRTQAGEMANSRAGQAYQRFQASLF